MASTNSNGSNLQREALKNSNDIQATHNPHNSGNPLSSLGQEDIKDPDSPSSPEVPDLPKNLGANTTAVISSAGDVDTIRPPIDYSSVGGFWRSSGRYDGNALIQGRMVKECSLCLF
jgi:hypothetical protein